MQSGAAGGDSFARGGHHRVARTLQRSSVKTGVTLRADWLRQLAPPAEERHGTVRHGDVTSVGIGEAILLDKVGDTNLI